jgi:Carboxypeptidase regulatory-like domain
MNVVKLVSIAIVFLGWANPAPAQPATGPAVVLENKEKPKKDSPYRIIQGIVKDQADNPLAGAIVQLKNTKTSKVIDFATKNDGKFAFRELSMENNYELLAKRGDLASPVKKVSIYDTRKEVIINFTLQPPVKQ